MPRRGRWRGQRRSAKEKRPTHYVALRISDASATSAFLSLQKRMVSRVPPLRAALVFDYHVTIALARGDDEDLVAKFQPAAFDAVEEEPLRFSSGLGRFDDERGKPRVVYAALADCPARTRLRALRDQFARLFGEASYDDDGEYTPHVTLLKTSRLLASGASPTAESLDALRAFLEDDLKDAAIPGDQSVERIELIAMAPNDDGTQRVVATLDGRRPTVRSPCRSRSVAEDDDEETVVPPASVLPEFVDSNGDLVAALPLKKRDNTKTTKPTPSKPPPREEKVVVFVYGELMRLDRFLPCFRGMAVPGKLGGWCLTFDAPGARENARPAATPRYPSYLRGVCYEISKDQLQTLQDQRRSYAAIPVADVERDDQRKAPALLFVARDVLDFSPGDAPKPPKAYVDVIKDHAARFFPFDEDYRRLFLDEVPTSVTDSSYYTKTRPSSLGPRETAPGRRRRRSRLQSAALP
mmetsp:Transcript_38742/g.124192  ORF Transcript_38742/g.124192 Transcript_38742/m.124192 type:complete len:467 (+) Transcript_38742:124-1524(+)